MFSRMETSTINPMQALQKFFLFAIAAWLFSAGSVFADGGATAQTPPPFSFPSPLKITGGIAELVAAIINNIILPLGASVIALAVIYSGFLYIKAQGKPDKIKEAHQALTYTLIGAAVLLGSWAIAQLIGGTINQLRSAVPAASYYANMLEIR